ncbi:hypothetical protein EJV47_27455 [Hymenobacter gummosus]|uniref:DUF3806 domain-containing protein n=1 Tax=Hymenobacter gummosus TaxID=1776032 RepID=A0A3S0H4T3_9BACT|nr:hypothetical protein [Hymenobacter gummosus]RTQ44732.1 hypothetical protein EJV47_27455 [Hymenobacter gummosus]
MATLRQDIHQQAAWLVRAFQADGRQLDFSLGSFQQLDDFFDEHSAPAQAKPGGRLATNLGQVLFAIGAYVGETIIRSIPGADWQLDKTDPQGEINAEVHLPGGSVIWPMQRVLKRFQHGAEDGLLIYGRALEPPATTASPNSASTATSSAPVSRPAAKPWYKFW